MNLLSWSSTSRDPSLFSSYLHVSSTYPTWEQVGKASYQFDACLTFDIVKNAISGKDPLNSRELCNPFNLEFPCAEFFYFSIKRQGNKSRSNYVSSKSIKSMTFFDYMGELTYKLPFKLSHALESIPTLVTWKVVHEKEKGEKAH